MNKRHKHCKLIKAWAEGAEIQRFCGGGWYDDSDTPGWFEDCEYRIKPRTVRRKGWIKIVKPPSGQPMASSNTFETEVEARQTRQGCFPILAVVPFEWEEEA